MYSIYSLDNAMYFFKMWNLGFLSLFTALNFMMFYEEIQKVIFHKMKTENWKCTV